MGKRKTRLSGTRMPGPASGLYLVQVNEAWQFDTGAVRKRIDAYLEEAAQTGKYSISGLCIALDIPRGVLSLWREGYVCEADLGDVAVLPNEELSRCIEMAMLHIQRYWEESDKPSSMNVKQLEATGALGENTPASAMPPFDLGRIKKFAQ